MDLLSKTGINIRENPPYKQLSEYNIFHILEIDTMEVIMCRFLADLLNPEEQHGCEILFLKSFLQDILKENCMSDVLLSHTQIITEYG